MQLEQRFSGLTIRRIIIAAGAAASFTVGACGHKDNTRSAAGDVPYSAPVTAAPDGTAPATATVVDTTTPQHHSKLGGALVGAAAGHMLGGHAVAGAAVGALVQHERNKHAKP